MVKTAQTARDAKYDARDDLNAPALRELAALDDTSFRQKFSGSPIKRIGRDSFLRNVLYAIGNSEDATLRDAASEHLNDPDPTVADAAAWACEQLEQLK